VELVARQSDYFWINLKIIQAPTSDGSIATRRPLMAQMRSSDRVRKCLLFGVDRTYRGHHKTDATDPERTFGTRMN
jgi:hypothetical protein